MMYQWCSMLTQEVTSLAESERPALLVPQLQALYAQANIHAHPVSALANVSQIVRDPQAQAALKAMKAAYPSTGSPDLTQEDIGIVYQDAICTAIVKTNVPADMLSEIVWTESRGHSLVYKCVGRP